MTSYGELVTKFVFLKNLEKLFQWGSLFCSLSLKMSLKYLLLNVQNLGISLNFEFLAQFYDVPKILGVGGRH